VPFRDAVQGDLPRWRSTLPKTAHVLRTGFARLDRLRFAETESLDSRASSGLADGHWLDLGVDPS